MNAPADMPLDASKPTLPTDKRGKPDRRKTPTSFWGCLPLAGRRVRQRRVEEHCRPYLVDRFPAVLLVFVIMLLLASIIDALLTIRIIEAGGAEVNPVMSRLLSFGLGPFLIGKYLLTAVGLPLLVVFKNFYLFGSRLRVGHLFPVLLALYAVLIGYQLVLMHRFVY